MQWLRKKNHTKENIYTVENLPFVKIPPGNGFTKSPETTANEVMFVTITLMMMRTMMQLPDLSTFPVPETEGGTLHV